MPLIDKIGRSLTRVTPYLGSRPLRLRNASLLATKVQECRRRYILDRAASRKCGEIMLNEGEDFFFDADIARIPFPCFWMEFYSDGDDDQFGTLATGERLGFLIESGPDGRSGRISCVGEDAETEVVLIAGAVEFDLNLLRPWAHPAGSYKLRHASRTALNRLLERASLVVDDDCRMHIGSSGTTKDVFVRSLAEMTWYALPMVISFVALLNSGNILSETAADLAMLDTARTGIGKPQLRDYVNVTLNLTDPPAVRRDSAATGSRHSPRLHFVRGHRVTRGGRTFWRYGYFRGEGLAGPIRTVSVTS